MVRAARPVAMRKDGGDDGEAQGIREFLPLWVSRRRWSDRYEPVEVPLFPGYVFCRLKPQARLPLLMIPGVMQFVGIGKAPAPIGDGEIDAIRTAVNSGLSYDPRPFLETGERVLVERGPLAGVEGLLVGFRKNYRLVVSVALLKRSVAVEIDGDWVTPVETGGKKRTVMAIAGGAGSREEWSRGAE